MYFYKLIVAYDGTSFFGWQFQPNKPTVEGCFRSIISGVFKSDDFLFVAVSRTDSGVHAVGQVVRLGMTQNIEPNVLYRIFNRSLPCDISVRSVTRVSDDFHPQKRVLNKRYTYTLFIQPVLPMYSRYGWTVSNRLCLQRLYDVLQQYVGTHDFRLYAQDPGKKTTLRTITSIVVDAQIDQGKITITIDGKSFLHHMIRRIVGAAVVLSLDYEREYRDTIARTLLPGAQDFTLMKNLPTAPARGLCLQEITYNENKES